MNVIERLEAVGWQGLPYRVNSDDGDWDHGERRFAYSNSGTLVFIVTHDCRAQTPELVEALNALPDLLKLARAVGDLPMNEPTNLHEWNQAVREFRALKAAYEPLFREVPS